jgi:GNAT superfamily N-acetyltransferase
MKAAVVQKRRENRLEMSRVDWSLVHRWVEEGPRRSPRSILVWARNRIEDDSIEEFARAFTEVFNQQPFGDSAFRGLTVGPTEVRDDEARIAAARGTSLTAYTREPDGRISGLTTVWRFPDMKERITQGMTGVREAFRGRGLGKWLKAAMLLRIREEFPEARFIATGNATSNEAMLSINERLGFRTHKEPILAQASLDPLEAHLATMPTKVQLEGAA